MFKFFPRPHYKFRLETHISLHFQHFFFQKFQIPGLMLTAVRPISRRTLTTTSALFNKKKPTSSSRGGSHVDVGDDGLPKDYKLKTLRAGSRRLDTFVNRATGQSSRCCVVCSLAGKWSWHDRNFLTTVPVYLNFRTAFLKI